MPAANNTIWDFEGLVTTTYMYLVSRYNDLPIYRDEPPADWDGLTGCVIIKDGGGNQLTTDQLLTGRVTLDIRHPDPAIAETSALHRRADGEINNHPRHRRQLIRSN